MRDDHPTEHELRALWSGLHSADRAYLAAVLLQRAPLDRDYLTLSSDAREFYLAIGKANAAVQSALYGIVECDLASE